MEGSLVKCKYSKGIHNYHLLANGLELKQKDIKTGKEGKLKVY